MPRLAGSTVNDGRVPVGGNKRESVREVKLRSVAKGKRKQLSNWGVKYL